MKKICSFSVLLVLLFFSGGESFASDDPVKRFDDLVLRYERRIQGRESSSLLRTALESEAETAEPYALWRSLFRPEISPRKGAANALSLLSSLVDRGDPAEWDSANGFVYPSITPKPLMAADSIYMAILFLLEMENEEAGHLAVFLLESFIESSRGKFFFVTSCPEAYSFIAAEMEKRNLLPSFGRWPDGDITGTLPFASPVRDWVTYGRALSEGMVFLDGAGRPQSNGTYAWDRKRGEIYTVIDESDIILFPFD